MFSDRKITLFQRNPCPTSTLFSAAGSEFGEGKGEERGHRRQAEHARAAGQQHLHGAAGQHLIFQQRLAAGAAGSRGHCGELAVGAAGGDVDFENVKETAGFITPVPGGVGPMTITMLLENTLIAAENSFKKKENQ